MSKVNLNEIKIDELEELEVEEKISKVKKTKMKPDDVRWKNKKLNKGRERHKDE